MEYDLSEFENKINESHEWLLREYHGLRTGRATPALLDSVYVEAYGSRTPLSQVANVGVEDARTLQVVAYDQSIIKDIERALTSADLGVGVSVADTSIRVSFPELTSERRDEIIKVAKSKLEEGRTTLRMARDDVWSDVQNRQKQGELSEDEKFKLKDEIQKKIDDANRSLEDVFKNKEMEILS